MQNSAIDNSALVNPVLAKLRTNLDIRYDDSQAEACLTIRCPFGLTKNPIHLSYSLTPILAKFDGVTTVNDLYQEFANFEGFGIEELNDLIKFLDSNFLLETEEFYKAEKKERERYSRINSRKATFEGISYPKDRTGLEDLVKYYLHNNKTLEKTEKKLNLLISPHIDYQRGGNAYGKAYNLLKGQRNDIYVMMGTSHQYSRHLFHLTKKHFEVPNGVALTETEIVEKIAELYGMRCLADEILHKNEHSLELQIPFLKQTTISGRVVPVLVGSFHQMILDGKLPEEYPVYNEFIDSFCAVIKRYLSGNMKVCFIAGVDMSHVGLVFGDNMRLTPSEMEKIKAKDQIYLDCISKQDKRSLFTHIAEDQDARRVCGYPTIYTLLDIMDRLEIKSNKAHLEHDMAVDYQNDCGVTFASGGLWG